jgi:hypothetical protein
MTKLSNPIAVEPPESESVRAELSQAISKTNRENNQKH